MAIQKITSGIIQDGAVAAADIVSVANTAITGNIISSQIAPDQTLNGNVSVTGTLSASDGISVANTFGFKNRIINGGMVIDQRNAGASSTPAGSGAGTYTLDRWCYQASATGKFTVQQNAGSVTPPAGFSKYLGLTVASAVTIGSGDYFGIYQAIEGQNVSDLGWGAAGAATVTLSFWVRSSLTGTFGGSVENGNSDRSYPLTYTISSANTWEQKTVTVAGDTTGTWLTTNGVGIYIRFGLGVGSTYSGTAGAWAAGDKESATGAVSVVGTAGATFYITGVQLEKGSTATSFDFRAYSTELAMCQRYCYVNTTTSNSELIANGYNTTASLSYINVVLPVTMRAAPSLTFSSAGQFGVYAVPANTLTCSAIALIYATVNNFFITTTSSGITAGQGTVLKNSGGGTATITASAEV
jgi:hypothetical protein